MRLAGLKCQPLVHKRAERYLVRKTDIDAWHRDRSALSAGPDRLPKYVNSVCREHRCRFDCIDYAVRCSASKGLATNGVNTAIRPNSLRQIHQPVIHILFHEVDRLSTRFPFCHFKALWNLVDSDNLFGSEPTCGSQRKLTDGAGTPDRNRVAL